jgi:hypothetical protein
MRKPSRADEIQITAKHTKEQKHMANENKQVQDEQKQGEQPTTQLELSDEQLEQVTGGGIKMPDSPATAYPPGPSLIGPEV